MSCGETQTASDNTFLWEWTVVWENDTLSGGQMENKSKYDMNTFEHKWCRRQCWYDKMKHFSSSHWNSVQKLWSYGSKQRSPVACRRCWKVRHLRQIEFDFTGSNGGWRHFSVTACFIPSCWGMIALYDPHPHPFFPSSKWSASQIEESPRICWRLICPRGDQRVVHLDSKSNLTQPLFRCPVLLWSGAICQMLSVRRRVTYP